MTSAGRCGTVRAMAHERLRFPEPHQPVPRTLPNALRNPLRAFTLLAAIVTIVGATLPLMRIWLPGRN